ncbi:MAG: GH32 C-terminal domain-containing protein [Sedimentisphaerales bacterium]|nr:GH32 C-terminal domain-containing protein [Sedimentisphaerales bacterium]
MRMISVLTKWIVLVGCIANPALGKVLAYESFNLETSELLIADFEGDTYGDWQVAGEAFGPGPAQGTLPNQMQVSGFKGKGLVNTFYQGDGTTGTLTSPAFTIERNFINFLIGGGGHPGQTCMNLLADGKVVRTAAGPNIQSGGSEQLDWQSWNVSELAGQTVRIQIVDQHTGGWGHINVDHIVQSNTRRQVIANKERTFELQKKYLNFPVKTGAANRLVRLFIDKQCVREFQIEIAPEDPDFWVYLDVSEFAGNQGTLQIDRYDSTWQTGFDAVTHADTFPGQDTLYHEKLRPQFHFTSRRGWNNDTNGMVYYKGQYHLFYQHNPYGWNWGNMTWGHAVSADMIHWQEWPDAIHPDALGTIFSGSAVVDHNNTAGLQTGHEKTLVAFYTSAGGSSPWSQGKPFTQSMAYSNDAGKTWNKYEHNPVVKHIVGGNRDPKVFWHDATNQWVMVLFLDGKRMAFFTSPDLKTWTKQSELDSFFECPELFELPVDGNTSGTKWILYGASGEYFVGRFDGKKFVPEGGAVRFQYGNCFYASQTFNDIPPSDGRRIQMAWGQIAMPDMPFNQMVLFPVSLTLHTTPEGIRMFAEPIREIQSLHQQHWQRTNLTVKPGDNPLADIKGELFRVIAEFKPQDAQSCSLVVRDIPIVYDAAKQQLTCLDKSAPLAPIDGKIRLEVLVDRMSIEIFANSGQVYMPLGVNLTAKPDSLQWNCTGGNGMIEKLDVYTLKSIWY